MSYLKWNDLLAEYFFNEEMSGKEVLMFVDELLINELGADIGEDLSDFISSLQEGPPWVNSNHNYGICQKALQASENWRSRKKLRYPPYIGYLALFVLAGYVEDENFSQIAYYPKLRALLREEDTYGQYPSFHKMVDLWMDLDRWSKEDKFEELGRFNFRKRGNWRHVGLPQSQTVISSKERKNIPIIFNRAGIISSDLPDSETLRHLLLEHGQDFLSNKTLRLLRLQEDNKNLLQALLDLVLDELNEWDGSLPEELLNSNTFVRSRIKLCLNLNKITKQVTFSVRINSQNEFPEESLFFQKRDIDFCVNCKRSIDNWSTELRNDADLLLDGTELDWLNGDNFEDLNNKWKCSLKGSTVRVFVEGKKFGLPNNLIEVPRIERGSRYVLICHKTNLNCILEWGKNSCETFRRIDYQGLPPDWYILSLVNPKKSCVGISELTLNNEIKIHLIDGLRVGKGNVFLKALPPKIVIENSSGTEVILLNDQPLEFDGESNYWKLPHDLPLNEMLTISVLNQESEVKKRNFKVTNSKLSIPSTKSFINKSGLSYEEKQPINIGVNVFNTNLKQTELVYTFPTHLSNEIIFIGQYPGEIFHWQGRTEIILKWEPVWAIYRLGRRKKWRVHFCSLKKIPECQINSNKIIQKDLRFWKQVMCRMPNLIEKPGFSQFNNLWESYLEVAKNV